MKNELYNGGLWFRMQRDTVMDADFLAKGWSADYDTTTTPNELITVSNVDGATPYGWVPGIGGGPGGGAKYSVQVLNVARNDSRFPHNSGRLLWYSWTRQPNQSPGSQWSGWGADSPQHHAPESTYDWRMSIVERSGPIGGGCSMFGARMGYSFYAFSSGKPINLRPTFVSYYGGAGQFFLHDLVGQDITLPASMGVAQEFCGFFDIPKPPEGQVIKPNACIGFVIDTTTKDLGSVMYYGFKVARFPRDWTGAASDIKNLVDEM